MERRSTLHHVSVGEEVQRPTDGAWSAVQSIVGPDAEGLYAVTFADGEKMRFTSSVVVLVRPHLAATPAPLPALAPPPPAPVPSPPRAPTPSPDLSWRGQVVKLATTYIVEQNDAALRLMDTQRDLALRATLHNTESVRQAAIRDAETAARIAKTVRAAADQPRPAAARRRAERDLGRMRCMSCGSESDDDKLRPCPRCGANQWALSDFEPPVARLAAARSAPRPQPAPRPARATGTSSRAVPGTSSGAVPAAREPVPGPPPGTRARRGRILDVVRASATPMSANGIVAAVGGRKATILDEVRALTREGLLVAVASGFVVGPAKPRW